MHFRSCVVRLLSLATLVLSACQTSNEVSLGDGGMDAGMELGSTKQALASASSPNLTRQSTEVGSLTSSKTWGLDTWSDVRGSAAIAADGSVIIAADNGKLYKLNPLNGAIIKSVTLGAAIRTMPAVGSDTIYVTGETRKLQAVNLSTFTLRWSYTAAGSTSSPVILPDGSVVFGSSDKLVHNVSALGSRRWTYTTGAAVTSSPAVGSDATVYITSTDGFAYALNGTTGALRWRTQLPSTVTASPALGRFGHLYVSSGDTLLALDTVTGTIVWRTQLPATTVHSAAVASSGTIYVGGTSSLVSGSLFAVTPDGRIVWQHDTLGGAETTPIVDKVGNIFFGANDGAVRAVNAAGKLLWKYQSLGPVKSSVSIGKDGAIIFGADDNWITSVGRGVPLVTTGGICTADAVCEPGLVCGTANGERFGKAVGSNVCWLPTCENRIQDPLETEVDCDGSCGTCTRICTDDCTLGMQVTPPALDTLSFSKGAFIRGSLATYQAGANKVLPARGDQLRYEDRGDGNGRVALFEGQRTNRIVWSEQLGHSPEWWSGVVSSPTMTLTEDATTAPDGTPSADRWVAAAAANGARAQTIVNAMPAGSLSAWVRLSNPADFSASNPLKTRAVLTDLMSGWYNEVGDWGLPAAWERRSMATRPATQSTAVQLSHKSAWPGSAVQFPALAAADFVVWGWQLEEGTFPSSYIATSESAATRKADQVIFDTRDVPSWLKTGTWQVDALPIFASTDIAVGDEFVLVAWEGGQLSLAKDAAGGALKVTSGTTSVRRTIAWARNTKLTITVDPAAASISVRGATAGDGTLSLGTISIGGTGRVGVGAMLDGTKAAFARISELRQVASATVECVPDPDCSDCGDGIVDSERGEECDPGLDAHCSSECAPSSWARECPDCTKGQVCPDEPNGAAFGLRASLRICVPSAVDCKLACGDSFDGPCGRCIKQPDCSAASCGSVTNDGTGQVCKQVCAPGQTGCLLDSDCQDGTHCMADADGTSACSAPLTVGSLMSQYAEPQRTLSGELCFEGPLCNACDSSCGSACNQIGECLSRVPACPWVCPLGCDPQGNCLQEANPDWPAGEPVLESGAVPPPQGALTVSDSGTASYTIPLTLPDGVSGHRPDLSFVYNSAAGDGALGRGWSLGGMSAISVCESGPRFRSIYLGGPSLCLDGEPLLPKQQQSGTGAFPGSPDDFTHLPRGVEITHFTGLYQGGYVVKGKCTLTRGIDDPFPSVGSPRVPYVWAPGREFTVHHEDGRTLYYGHATDDAFLLRGGGDPAMGSSDIRQWLLRRVTDRFGNTIEYRYQKAGVTVRASEQYDPKSQRYLRNDNGKPMEQRADSEAILRWIGYNAGSAEIAFRYVGDDPQGACSNPLDPYCDPATDLQLGRWQGGPLGRLMVLSRVDVRVSSMPVRSYGMGYAMTKKGGIHLLKTLQECGYTRGKRSCAPPLKFDYGDATKPDTEELGERLLVEGGNLVSEMLVGYPEDAFPHYARPNALVFDADGDGRDDFASFDKEGALQISTQNDGESFHLASAASEFPTFFYYKPKEQKEPWYARVGRRLLAIPSFGYTTRVRWGEEEQDELLPLPAGVTPTDINRDGLTDLVIWGVDVTQHVKAIEGSRDSCGGTVLCGSRGERHHYKATYPLGVWVYQASVNEGKLSYTSRRLFHEGFAGDKPGLAAMLPGIVGKDYAGVRVNNKGPNSYPNARIVTFDHNDDGQLDFLYCSNHQGGYGVLIESSIGLIHPDVPGLEGVGTAPESPDYEYTVVPGLPLDFCLDAQALRTRQGRTDLWSPGTRMVLAPTPAGPALFKETTFGELDFKTTVVRQIERNGDGLPDLAFHREGTDELEFWLNTGTGFVEGHAAGFQPANTLKDCDYKYLNDAAIADIDGNGLDDLVIPSCERGTNGAPGSLRVYYMHPGALPVQDELSLLGTNERGSEDYSPYAVWPGDFDGDGDTDFRYVESYFSDGSWRQYAFQRENATFSEGTSWKLLTRVHSTPVAGQAGTEILLSYVAGNGYRHEGAEAGNNGTPAKHSGELPGSCEPRQTLLDVTPPVAGQADPDTGRGGARTAVYSRTAVAGGCALGGLTTCAPRLPFPVVASYVERTADRARSTKDASVWADCRKTQMFYENGKQDTHQGFVGFERVTRRNWVPGAVRSVEVSEFDLGALPLPRAYVARVDETREGDVGAAMIPQLYVRPFAGFVRTQWLDEPMPSGAVRTTETDTSHALFQYRPGDRDDSPYSVTYAESRLPRLRAISNPRTHFWGGGRDTPVNYPPLMVAPVLRQSRVLERGRPLNTTATWWLRNGSGFVDNELSFSSQASTVQDLLSATFDFLDQASQVASGDLNHDTLSSWFGPGHDMSAVGARRLRQASPGRAPETWEARIGLFGLQGSETATTWARPLADGRQDVRRFSQSFSYEANGALRSTTEDNGDGSNYTYTITERARTGAVKAAVESATDAWSSLSEGKSWSFDLDDYGLYTVATTNPYGHVSKTRFDYASGQPVRTESPDGVATLASFDAFGRLVTDTVDGAETSLSYAWRSASPVTVALPRNPTGVAEVRVNASYRVVETTTRSAFSEVSAETWYDPAGRVVRSGQRGPLGDMVWSELVYDDRGLLKVQTRPHTEATTSTQGAVVITHDSLDRPTRVTRPNDTLSGARWDGMEYGSVGDPGPLSAWITSRPGTVRGTRQHTSDTQRAALVRTFDAEGRLLSALEHHAQEPESPVTTYTHGLSAPMAITGPDGDTLRTSFDLLGRVERTVDPSSGTLTQRYDGFGRLREQRDNDVLHRFEYDLLDRPLLHSRHYEKLDEAFGAFGRDKVTTWIWDVLPESTPKPKDRGKLLRISNNDGHAEAYTYGGPFALQESVTRAMPRRDGVPLFLKTQYEYDRDGRPTVLRHPSEGLATQRAQTYRYNERGALTAIDATMAGATRTIWELDEVYQGRLLSKAKVLEGTREQTYYAGSSALQRLTVKAGTRSLVDENLIYNDSGLLDIHEDLAGNTAHRFVYDRFKRLKEKRRRTGTTAASVLESFEYSKGGRVAKKNGASLTYTVNGQPAPWPDAVKRIERAGDAVDYKYQAAYGLMTSMRGTWQGKRDGLEISYDLDREVRQVTWDTGVTRMLGLTPTGERAAIYETSGGIDSFTGYAGLHYERAETGSNTVHLFRFTDETGQAVLEERVEQQTLPNGTIQEQSLGYQHLARDHRGSVAAIFPSGGAVTRRTYEAFGASSPGTGTDLGYTGHRQLQIDGSPLGLIDMGGRVYDPLSAQFTRADPFMPNADTPKGFNRLAYVQGDPINFVDRNGFWGSRPDCNPNGGGCVDPLEPPPGGGGGGGPVCNYSCRQAKKDFKSGAKKFFKTITGVQAVQDKRERDRRERRFKNGLIDLQGGGAAPNTSPTIVDRTISALDQYQLRAFNVTSEALTGAGDFVTGGGSAWARDKLFGEGAIRTDTTASWVGAGAGFAVGGGVQAIRAIPGAVRAIPGVVRAVPGALRAAPGMIQAAGRGIANFMLKHVGIPGMAAGSMGGVKGVQAARGTGTALAKYWPANNGFLGKTAEQVLQVGQRIDRYGGSKFSQFFSPAGTPAAARALPADTASQALRTFEVLKPLSVEAGTVAPAFGQLGMGTQYRSGAALGELIEQGFLREVL